MIARNSKLPLFKKSLRFTNFFTQLVEDGFHDRTTAAHPVPFIVTDFSSLGRIEFLVGP